MKVRNRLDIKVAVIVAFCALLCASVFSVADYYYRLGNETLNAQKQIDVLGKTVKPTAIIAAYLDDDALAEEILSGLIQHEIISAVQLVSFTGLRHQKGEVSGNTRWVSKNLLHPFDTGIIIGRLDLSANELFIQQLAKEKALSQGLSLFGISLVTALLVGLMIHRTMTHPLLRLTRVFEGIQPHNPQPLTIPRRHRDNEIGIFLLGINRLMIELRTHIHKERYMREKTERLEKKFRMIFEQSSAGICILDPHNLVLTSNRSFCRLFSCHTQHPVLFHELFSQPDEIIAIINELRDGRRTFISADLTLPSPEENAVPRKLHCLLSKIIDPDVPENQYIELVAHDVTERVQKESVAHYEASHDELTGLYNRRAGERILTLWLDDALENNKSVAVIIIDLNGFKLVNDSFGHDAGDQILREVSSRIRKSFRTEDACIRWGGDEFVVIQQISVPDMNLLRNRLKNFLFTLKDPIAYGSELIRIGGSIGVSIAPQDGRTISELLGLADKMMYTVKSSRRSGMAFYNDLQQNHYIEHI
ncbi:diguanylate cyclase [Parasalinivibrio latis]|uniref:diguanylate cyclase n=1 Tax=Parasalinivibrio latis TaxID=2952610 RepID=UPI0030E25371